MESEYGETTGGFVLSAGANYGDEPVDEFLREENGYYESVSLSEATKYNAFKDAQKAADMADKYGVTVFKLDEYGVLEETIGKRDKPKKESVY